LATLTTRATGEAMRHQIFLSYCRKDERVAEAFCAAASARNLSVWYDKLIPGGLDWRDSIVAAIEGCEIVLILFSQESNKSRQLIKELAIADKHSKLVVPVLIENTEPRGAYLYEMAARNWINLHPDPALRLPTLLDSLALQLIGRSKDEAAAAPQSAASYVTEANVVRPAVPVLAPLPEPIAPKEEHAKPTPDAVTVAIRRRATSLPIKPIDIYVLAPLLVLNFGLGVYNGVDYPAAGFNMALLLGYMLVVAIRNARSNISIYASRSFSMYLCIALLLIPFGLAVDWITGREKFTNYGLTFGLMILALLVAACANVFQFLLRKAFQRNIFKARLGNPLPVQSTPR
jgi:hypothetical protein